MIDPNQFIGTWRLVSWENRDSEGNVTYPFGEDAVGYLIYAADGYMSGTLSKANRPHFAAGDVLGGTIEEQAMATQTYVAYGGKYEIQPDRVIHRVEVSLFPNWVGAEQARFFKFQDGKLVLSTPPLNLSGKQQTAHLIWERVAS